MKITILLLTFLSSIAFAHEPNELTTLRATNEALNLRLAQLLEENARLRKSDDTTVIAQAGWKSVSAECDPNELRRLLTEGSGRQFNATEWLKRNARKCSKADLQYIAINIHDWTSYAMYDAIRLAKFYADQK
jgi:hypothetical protein